MNFLRVQNEELVAVVTVCTLSNCCLSLYLNVGLLWEGLGKTFRQWQTVLELFVSEDVGTLRISHGDYCQLVWDVMAAFCLIVNG